MTISLSVVISVPHPLGLRSSGKLGVVLPRALPQLPTSHDRGSSGIGAIDSGTLPVLLSPGWVFLAHFHHHPYCRILMQKCLYHSKECICTQEHSWAGRPSLSRHLSCLLYFSSYNLSSSAAMNVFAYYLSLSARI